MDLGGQVGVIDPLLQDEKSAWHPLVSKKCSPYYDPNKIVLTIFRLECEGNIHIKSLFR